MRRVCQLAVLCLCGLAGSSWAAGPGLRVADEEGGPSAWRARLEFNTSAVVSGLGVPAAAVRHSLRLMGDYNLGQMRLGQSSVGQFHLTSGLWYGPRSMLLAAVPGPYRSVGPLTIGWSATDAAVRRLEANPEPSATWPYLGLGYSGALFGGTVGLNADLGWTLQSPGAASWSRALDGSSALDSMLRDLRLTPMLRLGMSYRF